MPKINMTIKFHKNDLVARVLPIKNRTMSTRYPHLDSQSKTMRLAYKSGK